MNLRLCAAEDCQKPFEPLYEQQETQKYCSLACGNRQRVRNCRARHKVKPNGGPGGKRRQARLFPASAVNRRTKPKPEIRLKQDDLFPDEGAGLIATFGGAVKYAGGGSVSDNEAYNRYSVKSGNRPPESVPAHQPEARFAA
jgi:hypothetical protein